MFFLIRIIAFLKKVCHPYPKYACGSCGAAVRHNQNSIQCDGCNYWYHINCQGMNTSIHQIMAEHSSYSWNCLKCGLPNFSTAIYEDFLTSDCSMNNFSVLDSSVPPRTSTPIKKKTFQKNSNKLKILNINFQSVVNKVPEFQCVIDTEKPDVVIGMESWLSPEISSSEIFPLGYTAYRRDRDSKKLVGECLFWCVTILYAQSRHSSTLTVKWYGLNWRLLGCTHYISVHTINQRKMIREVYWNCAGP